MDTQIEEVMIDVTDLVSSGMDIYTLEFCAVAVILVGIGFVAGLILFHILSRRWFA